MDPLSYLEVLLPVESDRLGLDFAFLDIDLVAAQDNRNVLTDTNQITYSSTKENIVSTVMLTRYRVR